MRGMTMHERRTNVLIARGIESCKLFFRGPAKDDHRHTAQGIFARRANDDRRVAV